MYAPQLFLIIGSIYFLNSFYWKEKKSEKGTFTFVAYECIIVYRLYELINNLTMARCVVYK